jgi:hypothetical protein
MSAKARKPVISLGAGIQSSALLLMAVEGELRDLGDPDLAIFADTQWESARTYEWLGFLRLTAWKAGIEVATVTTGSLRGMAMSAAKGEGRWASMPLYTINPNGSHGMLNQQCSKEYKVAPARRELRRRGINSAEMWLGITTDEVQRVKDSDVQWVSNRYPLVERRLSRLDCEAWLDDHCYPQPPKSACLGCPYTRDVRWFDMRENRPEEWADAVDADRILRHLPGIAAECFIHRSRVPLKEAVLDPSDYGQGSLDLQGECEGTCFV